MEVVLRDCLSGLLVQLMLGSKVRPYASERTCQKCDVALAAWVP